MPLPSQGVVLPQPGTPQWAEFERRAKSDPLSVEAGVMRQLEEANAKAVEQVQARFRAMLDQMQDLVPGQMFRDVSRFHEKFKLSPTEDHGHELPEDLLKFRIKFMLEELSEYSEAVGFNIDHGEIVQEEREFDAETALDSLVDLCYVALGTAYLHRFPFNEAWARVQEANMAKVRAESADDPRSTRKHSADVVKPSGWFPPKHTDLLDESCTDCDGSGKIVFGAHELDMEEQSCCCCNGTGRVKRKCLPTAGA